MLPVLQTLKSEPFEEQIRILESLAEQNLHLFERIRPLFAERPENSIFRVSVSKDRRQVVQVALLACLAADIATIPDQGAREPYLRNLDALCNHFAIDVRDVMDMVQYVSQFEHFLEGRP